MTKNTVTFVAQREISQSEIVRALQNIGVLVSAVKVTSEKVRVLYPPSGAHTIRSVRVSFTRKISKDTAEGIVEYWASLPFVGALSRIDWSAGVMVVHVDVSKSRSHDVEARKILDNLLEFLENGTILRKDGTRAHDGLGKDSVALIEGVQ